MSDDKTIHVRHTHTGEIRKVTPDEREVQDKNFWVRVTGDVEATAPETTPPADVEPTPAPKTASKVTTPAK
jgi:hypothetical protein